MSELKQISWIVFLVVATVGVLLTWAGLKLSSSKFEDKKDLLGVRYSERSLFLLGNGLLLLGVSLIGAVLKLAT